MHVLGCGHPDAYIDGDLLPDEIGGYRFTCQECDAEDQEVVEVLGSLSRAEAEAMSDDDFEAWSAALVTAAGVAQPA
ncbi:MAG: hypothetical protein ACRDZ6_03430 [Acidimicrobiales bacterium]